MNHQDYIQHFSIIDRFIINVYLLDNPLLNYNNEQYILEFRAKNREI